LVCVLGEDATDVEDCDVLVLLVEGGFVEGGCFSFVGDGEIEGEDCLGSEFCFIAEDVGFQKVAEAVVDAAVEIPGVC
jgi:hypothetical protein